MWLLFEVSPRIMNVVLLDNVRKQKALRICKLWSVVCRVIVTAVLSASGLSPPPTAGHFDRRGQPRLRLLPRDTVHAEVR